MRTTATPAPEIDLGALLRRVHRHAWRADAPPLDLELAEVVALLPSLVKSGSVGLVWPRLRHRTAEYGAAGMALEAAFQAQIGHNATVERDIAAVVSHLREHGIEPVLVKGFAIARLYPEGVVRPAGDIDLVVRDGDYERAKRLLAGGSLALHEFNAGRVPHDPAALRLASVEVDLHAPAHWEDFPGEGFFARATTVPIGGGEVLVPSAEEHLHVLASHFLRHGGVRYLRLCDIALLVEAELDWDRALAGDSTQANWVLTAARLAQELLGAETSGTPVARHALPGWLPALAERRLAERQVDPGEALGEFARRPGAAWTVLRRRWPDPIAATTRLPAAFNGVPRLPIQWAVYLRRLGGWSVRRFPKQARALLGRDRGR